MQVKFGFEASALYHSRVMPLNYSCNGVFTGFWTLQSGVDSGGGTPSTHTQTPKLLSTKKRQGIDWLQSISC